MYAHVPRPLSADPTQRPTHGARPAALLWQRHPLCQEPCGVSGDQAGEGVSVHACTWRDSRLLRSLPCGFPLPFPSLTRAAAPPSKQMHSVACALIPSSMPQHLLSTWKTTQSATNKHTRTHPPCLHTRTALPHTLFPALQHPPCQGFAVTQRNRPRSLVGARECLFARPLHATWVGCACSTCGIYFHC